MILNPDAGDKSSLPDLGNDDDLLKLVSNAEDTKQAQNGEESTASAAAWAEEPARKKKKTKSVIEHEDQPDAPSVGCVAAPTETASAASPKRKKRKRTRRKSSPVQHRVAQFEPHHAFRNSAVHVIMPMLADVGNGKLQLTLRHPFAFIWCHEITIMEVACVAICKVGTPQNSGAQDGEEVQADEQAQHYGIPHFHNREATERSIGQTKSR